MLKKPENVPLGTRKLDQAPVTMRRLSAGTYRGWDEGTNMAVRIEPGETARVSMLKALQLESDFPGDWERVDVDGSAGPVWHAEDTGMTMAVQGCGPAGSSMTRVTSLLATGLRQLGVDVRELKPGSQARANEVLVCWGAARALKHDKAGCHAVISPVDAYQLTDAMVKRANEHVHLSLGLSEHSTNELKRFGIERTAALPLCVDPGMFRETKQRTLPKVVRTNAHVFCAPTVIHPHENEWDRFWFLHVSAMQDRKSVPELVEAFVEEFEPDEPVGLILKAFDCDRAQAMLKTVRKLLKGRRHPPVVFSFASLSDEDMCRLYNVCGAYVSLSRLEGFGLPPLEAMACGTPCVLSACGGHLDYATVANSVLIPGEEMPMISGDQAAPDAVPRTVAKNLRWTVVSHEDARAALRRTWDGVRNKEAWLMGLVQTALRTAAVYSPVHTAGRLVEALEEQGTAIRKAKGRVRSREIRTIGDPPWHIVFASPCWFRGGLESVTLSHLRYLKDRDDWKVSLVVGKTDEMRDEVPKGITFVEDHDLFEWTQGSQAATRRAALRAEGLFRELAPDILVSSLCHGALYGAEEAGVPLIVEYWHLGWGWDVLHHPSDGAMAVSGFVAKRVQEARQQAPPTTVIYNGTDCRMFKPADKKERAAARKKFGLGTAPVVGYSGRISMEKRPLDWLECFARIRERIPEVKGFVAGAQFARGLQDQFFKKANSLGMRLGEDLVHVAVNHSAMPELYRAMDVLLHMRHDEPFGMILPESILTGTPVVAFAGGGIPEIAAQLPDGLDTVPVGDQDAMVDLVCGKLKARSRVSEEGMHTCRKRFSDEVMVTNVEDYLREQIMALRVDEEEVTP